MFRVLGLLLFATVIGSPLLDTRVLAGGGRSDSKVKSTVTATKPDADGKQKVTITLDIDKGWYLYANPLGGNEFANRTFGDNRTTVTIKAKNKVNVEVNYPKGKFKSEDILGDIAEWHIYQDRTTIEAVVRRAAGDSSPLDVQVQVNACLIGKDGKTSTCLQPGNIMVKVP